MTGSYVFLTLLSNCHTVFHSGYINLHSHQQCTKVLSSSYPCRYLSVVNTAIPSGMRWYLIRVLIWVSMMISDVEHLFMYLLDICISSLEKHLFTSTHLFIYSFAVALSEFFIYFWCQPFIRYLIYRYFLAWLCFNFCWLLLLCGSFSVKSSHFFFFLLVISFVVRSKTGKIIAKTNVREFIINVLWGFGFFPPTLSSMWNFPN